MAQSSASAHGKIILTGEYAVIFGKRGIAIPSNETMNVTWVDDPQANDVKILWNKTDTDKQWMTYVQKILSLMKSEAGERTGTLEIHTDLPLGKGMGSSTALVIAMCRCLLGDECKNVALRIENEVNPGNSGIDFAVIWENRPVIFQKETKLEFVTVPDVIAGTRLIDTGTPNETTQELVAWMHTRKEEIAPVIEVIGQCTERLLQGESIKEVIRDHHRAQISLGVVPEATQKTIAEIESKGGAAKVIGAGGRTGGGGMVLVFP